MQSGIKTVPELTREFFSIHPDYGLCRTLAANVLEGVQTERQAVGHLSSKAWAHQKNQATIREKLDARSVEIAGRRVPLKSLSLRNILDQPDELLEEILAFYLKHPYAHGRTFRSRLLPNWLRGFFLRVLIGNAKTRGLSVDYGECFELLTLL